MAGKRTQASEFMQDELEHTTRVSRRRGTIAVIAVVGLIAAGLFVWNRLLLPVRYELEIERGTLYVGAPDTARIRAQAINRMGGVIPFMQVPLRAVLLEGSALGRLEPGDHELLFITNGVQEGTVRLRVMADDWPFPLLAELRVVVSIAEHIPSANSLTRSTS
ncbi:MAG: hypothetical protein KFF77_09640 [Bacteroidetes bacterium]|nr:hypothetical protein [Bacteroidota bacterium]